MVNIFESFLPQLLRYPNPSDPLNGEAANMLMREPKAYEEKVKRECSNPSAHGFLLRYRGPHKPDYVRKYATQALADSARPCGESSAPAGPTPSPTEESKPDTHEEEEDAEISDGGSYDDDDAADAMDL